MYKKIKRPTVQLTSLLDLLFVMVFLSLLQTKNVQKPAPQVTKAPVSKPKEVVEKKKVEVKPTIINITATFNFYPTAKNNSVQAGSFIMQGSFNRETKEITLGGSQWIHRPKDYDMVPLIGRLSADGNKIIGKIDFSDCKQFTLNRQSSQGIAEVSGIWKGSYDCLQGETGLTLTIN